VKKQKAKTKSKSGSAVKETHNGLPSRVTSNGLIDDPAAGTTDIMGSGGTGKVKKKSKTSKHGKTSQSQSTADSPCSVDMAADKQVNIRDFDYKIFSAKLNHLTLQHSNSLDSRLC